MALPLVHMASLSSIGRLSTIISCRKILFSGFRRRGNICCGPGALFTDDALVWWDMQGKVLALALSQLYYYMYYQNLMGENE